jgi:hypothetical protein
MLPSKKLTAAVSFFALSLAGCYVVPVVDPQGNVQYYHYPLPPAGTPVVAAPGTVAGTPLPQVMQARLYPVNEIAARTGMLTGTVTNMMTGTGRFQLQYKGELLTGEATRVSNEQRRGVASAFGSGGTSLSCEYQMTNPRLGVGTCTFSDGAKYQVHVGG